MLSKLKSDLTRLNIPKRGVEEHHYTMCRDELLQSNSQLNTTPCSYCKQKYDNNCECENQS